MGEIRNSLPLDRFGRFGMKVGEVWDYPRLPSTILLDDINQCVVELMADAPFTKSEYYRYKYYSYPFSHQGGKNGKCFKAN